MAMSFTNSVARRSLVRPCALGAFVLAALRVQLHVDAAPIVEGTTAHVAIVPKRTDAGEVDFVVFDEPTAAASAEASATASFVDGLLETGWGVLSVDTSGNFPDTDQAFSAGMAEGYLTAKHIYKAQLNLYPNVFGANVTGVDQVKPEVLEFMSRQEAWTRVMVNLKAKIDPFWAHVGYIMAQFDGLVAGYAVAARRGHAPALERFAFTMLNGVGDLFDILPAVSREHRTDWMALPLELAERVHTSKGHCSGLIKVLGDNSDLFMAHSSWFTYSNTNRIFKHYYFNYSDPSTAARRVSFSSYPGFLESLDDFYLLDSGLGWIQTTNTVLDQSVYDEHVKPESLLAWQRVRVASAMSHSGREWYEHLRRHFSGTYANQYMVVDFKRFTPKQPIKADTLWVVEEMPGLVVGGDRSETLARGYWPSYNVPYWPEIYEKSGYTSMAAKHGNYFSYEMCPRAQISRRDQGKVVDIDTLKAFMRYNDYLNDPYSIDSTGSPNPTYAICSRGDLHAKNATAEGCYDSKVTSYMHGAMALRADAVSGPTRSKRTEKLFGDQLPVFTWRDQRFAHTRHDGLPEQYEFEFVDMQPLGLRPQQRNGSVVAWSSPPRVVEEIRQYV
eukprot:TRINITY_DN73143_c0_g1_i1.p1 TRINITY_DN73143_c0_g1~~TRINITY_DN73143_c0_g1_i1.p1  ORF type:complete len:614 (+),score=131.30 TRINITY_DN73143_c0_g1_i1:129-1970(+)